MQKIVMAHLDNDLAEFKFESILALSDLVISYSYSDDSTRAKSIALKAYICDDELWISSPENVSMSLWLENSDMSS